MKARHTAETAEWYSPAAIVDPARVALGGAIDLDPMTCHEANENQVRAGTIYTQEEDGLAHPWFGRVFLNPPTGLVRQAWQKLLHEWYAGHLEAAIWVGYSLEQLQVLQADGGRSPCHYPFCVPAKRTRFVESEPRRAERFIKHDELNARRALEGRKPLKFPEKASPSHANYVTYLGLDRQRFAAAFEALGHVCNLHKGPRHAEGTRAPRTSAEENRDRSTQAPDPAGLVPHLPAALGRGVADAGEHLPLSRLWGEADHDEPGPDPRDTAGWT